VSSSPEVSVVVPLKDEEQNIVPLYEELVSVLSRSESPFEIVLVDDGSVDGTFDRAAELHQRDARVRVIRFSRNFGQTAAFAAGFSAARGRLVVTLDGDLQNDPGDIPHLLQLAPEYEVVCGWRRHRHDNPLTRKLPSVIANYLLGVVSGVRLHDNGCSLKVFRADVVKALRLRPGMHRYLPALASQSGARVTEVVVNHRPRRFGRSKYGLSRTFRVLADVVRLRTLMKQATEGGEPPAPIYSIASRLD
jgi:glycosyltransferase involved in cell wall biosynthesis